MEWFYAFLKKNGNTGFPTPKQYLDSGTPYTEIDDGTIVKVRAYAFYHSISLERVDLPNVTSVGDNAFDWCLNMTSANMPKVTTLGANAFKACSKLETFNSGALTTIGEAAFTGCTQLTEIDLSAVTSIGKSAFANTGLTSLELPAFTAAGTVNQGCFTNSRIATINLPQSTKIGHTWFQRCPISVIHGNNVPVVADVQDWAFSYCENLIEATFPSATQIRRYSFRGSAIAKLVLPGATVCAIASDSFLDTPITNGTGYVYVPDELVETYKNTNNWKTIEAQIRPISDNVE